MLDYTFVQVSRYDGTTRTQRAIEVFHTVTGTTLSITRRLPFETRDAWIQRAIERARMNVA